MLSLKTITNYTGSGTRTGAGGTVTVVQRLEQNYVADLQGNLLAGSGDLVITNVIYGSTGRDEINGLTGDDALSGGAGNDTLNGGAGSDFIGGGAGSDNILGGDGNDYISSGSDLDSSLQLMGPGDMKWSQWGMPTGSTPVQVAPTWGVYRDVSGYAYWSGMAKPNQQDTSGDVIDAGAGDDWVIGGFGDDRAQGYRQVPVLSAASPYRPTDSLCLQCSFQNWIRS
jgi:Ca2+-binding RTX toxin-like protein